MTDEQTKKSIDYIVGKITFTSEIIGTIEETLSHVAILNEYGSDDFSRDVDQVTRELHHVRDRLHLATIILSRHG